MNSKADELKRDYERRLAELTKEGHIAESLPDFGDLKRLITIQSGRAAPWVSYGSSYQGQTGSEYRIDFDRAMEIFDTFAAMETIVPMEDRKGTFRTIAPVQEFKDRELENSQLMGTYAIQLRSSGSVGEYSYTRLELVFYVKIGGQLLRIGLNLTNPYKLHPVCTVERDRANRTIAQDFRSSDLLFQLKDTMVRYAGGDIGPIKKVYEFVYLFVADNMGFTSFDVTRAKMATLQNECWGEKK